MAKRKIGRRHACGKLVQPKAKERNAMRAAEARSETEFAQQQPGRRGEVEPDDPRLESELGRFCKRQGLRRECMAAGLQWKELRRLFVAAWGGPVDEHHGGGGMGQGPSMATSDGWKTKLRRIEEKLYGIAVDDPDTGRMNKARYMATKALCLDNQPVPRELVEYARDGLRILAIELQLMDAREQPFERAA